MEYRFKLADGVDSSRVLVSTAMGEYLIGNPLDEDTLSPVEGSEIVTESAAEAALLREAAHMVEVTTDAPDTAAQEYEDVPQAGDVPQSVADLHPDAFRNTEPDQILPDEAFEAQLARDDSSPATETDEPLTPTVPEPRLRERATPPGTETSNDPADAGDQGVEA